MTEDTPGKDFPFGNTAEAVRPLIKMVTLANAGGVAATITVIGATAKDGNLENVLAMPLGLFALGVVFSIGYAMSVFLKVAKHEGYILFPPPFLIADFFQDVSGYGAVAIFIGGCLSGVGIVACA